MKGKIELLRRKGAKWILFRTNYEIKKKTGLLKKEFPAISYEEIELSINKSDLRNKVINSLKNGYYNLNIEEIISYFNENKNAKRIILEEANEILENNFCFFSKHNINMESLNWNYSPFTKKYSSKELHWTEIEDLSSDFGDIKWIWEFSRFSFTYRLCQAYLLTGEELYAIKFWTLFEDFIFNNPPEKGVNYKCGQEMSFRVMAWIYALNIFKDSIETSDKRLEIMVKAIYHHTQHINKHFNFALKSVKNNHSISEAVCLYTVGSIFEFFDKATKWKVKGLKFVQSESNWQIYNDGSYLQHSFNYQRLVIQNLTYFINIARINSDNLNREFTEKYKKTIDFLYQMQCEYNGQLPNYGMNDGSFIFPVSTKGYLDYRPTLQAALYSITEKGLYIDKNLNEELIWMGIKFSNNYNNIKKISKIYEDGGYIITRNKEQFLFLRCASYKNKPVQADMLHLDFWDRDFNVFADAGTFSYNTLKEEQMYFIGTSSHNTVKINDIDQMKKASRFMWLNWTKSNINRYKFNGNKNYFEGEHYGYSPIIHRRSFYQEENILIVIDDVFGHKQNSKIELNWLLGIDDVIKTAENTFNIKLPNGQKWDCSILSNNLISTKIYKGSTLPFQGWQSLYYGYKEAKPQINVQSSSKDSIRIITLLTKGFSKKVDFQNDRININGKIIDLYPCAEKKVFKHFGEWGKYE